MRHHIQTVSEVAGIDLRDICIEIFQPEQGRIAERREGNQHIICSNRAGDALLHQPVRQREAN